MKILIVGLGSMGKRRLRLAQAAYPSHEYAGVEAKTDRRESLGIPVYGTLEEAFNRFEPDAAFICTPPLTHAGMIRTCLEHNLHVFTEINLVQDAYPENLALARKQNRVLFLSSTYLYREEIRQIRKRLDSKGPFLYTYHVGQYLPDWHPWERYQDMFLSERRTNGCREILTINLPWLVTAFGPVHNCVCVRKKMTALALDYPDSYFIILEHENGNTGVFTADLTAREAVCRLRVESERILLEWDGKPDTLQEFDMEKRTWNAVTVYDAAEHLKEYNANIIENAYAAEIDAFFSEISGKHVAQYGFQEDAAVLDWIDRMETELSDGAAQTDAVRKGGRT